VAAGDVPDREGHREHGQAERQRHAEQPDADLRECGGEHGAATTAEDEPERADELRGALAAAPAPVLLSTDLGNEIDDQYLLLHLLASPRVTVVGIAAAQAPTDALPEGTTSSAALLHHIVGERLQLAAPPRIVQGAHTRLPDRHTPRPSDAAGFILDASRGFGPQRRLTVLVTGAATDVASALLLDPTLAQRIRVVAMGFRSWDAGGTEFNIENDPDAWRVLLASDVPLVVGDGDTTQRDLSVSRAEVAALVRGSGAIAPWLLRDYDHWYDTLVSKLDFTKRADGTRAWPLWDHVVLAELLGLATVEQRPRPRLGLDLKLIPGNDGRQVGWVTQIDRAALFADFARTVPRLAARATDPPCVAIARDAESCARRIATAPSPALLGVRRRMTDADVNTLVFHNIDEIFETRPVPTAGRPSPLPSKPRALDFTYRFGEEDVPAERFAERTYTNALLVLRDGVLVHERYYNRTNADTRFLSMSMAKSITSILVGMAIADGAIGSVDDLVTKYVPELSSGAYAGVTIRQALMMRSGADWNERYDFSAQSPMMRLHNGSIVENRIRFTEPALTIARKAAPGSTFNYSTLETGVLGLVVARAARQPLEQYMSERFWKRAGMQADGYFLADGAEGFGRVVNGMGFNATARDFARIGLMMLDDGRANGRQLLPAAWVRESTVPSPGNEPTESRATLGYQYQWWTFTDSEAYTAIGLQGQRIYVDPVTRTVVVKLSYFPPGDPKPEAETEAFLRAVSKWAAAGR
jgi:CubicO group peptidase (beta-lactamase class C family)/inosine-uridine nucleoside N-ribohydrolase